MIPLIHRNNFTTESSLKYLDNKTQMYFDEVCLNEYLIFFKGKINICYFLIGNIRNKNKFSEG